MMSQSRLRDQMLERLRREGWTILQRAAAAVIAFVIARWIGDHQGVFFAPIAAIVSLNTDVGDRGFNALKLLLGVFTDRKSTRLSSSHVAISYAVFCLKKKKQRQLNNT